MVLAASSLEGVVEALIAGWQPPATVSAAGSQVLAAQVRAGSPADLLLLADPALAEALHVEGRAGPPVAIAHTGLALLVRADAGVGGVTDLERPELRVVLADPSVPLGAYTQQSLARLAARGVFRSVQTVLAGVDSLEDAARLVVAKLTAGEADAAVVYASDAVVAVRADPGLRVVAWPDPVTVTYTGQALTPEGQRLLEHLRSPAAAATWREWGFEPVG